MNKIKKEASKIQIPSWYERKVLDLEVEIAKLKIDNKFYKNELALCKEQVNANKK